MTTDNLQVQFAKALFDAEWTWTRSVFKNQIQMGFRIRIVQGESDGWVVMLFEFEQHRTIDISLPLRRDFKLVRVPMPDGWGLVLLRGDYECSICDGFGLTLSKFLVDKFGSINAIPLEKTQHDQTN
ncbi:hypothetical protein LCGC14_0630730 [marine sediment metagenome]|uniref:Uncharacterized protein n=1 Tax=marine sediment metagenome TaxID=412755 RepID=A0A0F9TNF8_9ZZZZ